MSTWDENLVLYEAMIALQNEILRQGKANPYTSLNGHISTFFDKTGTLVVRLSPEDKKAFEEGIIDADGKRIKTYKKGTEAYKEYYTPFHRLVFNVKRLMSKVPGGGSRLASYAAALYLISLGFAFYQLLL